MLRHRRALDGEEVARPDRGLPQLRVDRGVVRRGQLRVRAAAPKTSERPEQRRAAARSRRRAAPPMFRCHRGRVSTGRAVRRDAPGYPRSRSQVHELRRIASDAAELGPASFEAIRPDDGLQGNRPAVAGHGRLEPGLPHRLGGGLVEAVAGALDDLDLDDACRSRRCPASIAPPPRCPAASPRRGSSPRRVGRRSAPRAARCRSRRPGRTRRSRRRTAARLLCFGVGLVISVWPTGTATGDRPRSSQFIEDAEHRAAARPSSAAAPRWAGAASGGTAEAGRWATRRTMRGARLGRRRLVLGRRRLHLGGRQLLLDVDLDRRISARNRWDRRSPRPAPASHAGRSRPRSPRRRRVRRPGAAVHRSGRPSPGAATSVTCRRVPGRC